jgi:hypothetical protein
MPMTNEQKENRAEYVANGLWLNRLRLLRSGRASG